MTFERAAVRPAEGDLARSTSVPFSRRRVIRFNRPILRARIRRRGNAAMTTPMRSTMCLILLLPVLFNLVTGSHQARAQTAAPPAKLSVHWEELTAADFSE